MPSLHTTCSPACSSARLARLQVASSMLSNLGRAVEQTKPRILVCTPSNAACDELLTRVMSEGFCDGSGEPWMPAGVGASRICQLGGHNWQQS